MGERRAQLEPLSRRDPERIGSYVLLGRLGAGSMGRVYLGRSAAGRLVAVKTIRLELVEEADFRTRFAHEVAAARRVSGVFTAAVVAADPDADVPWLATAYVPAPSLEELVHECGALPVPAVRWLAAGCAEALESIHAAGLVHRDLKPSNVLVSLDGPRVIDFGLARAVGRVQMTGTRVAIGTPAYMAPEQARGPRHATTASDVFSLGATLLFAASGHGPYRGETMMEVMAQLATEPPDLDGLPTELADIVAACLARDPAERPTPAELLTSLAPHVDSAAGPEPGLTSLPRLALALVKEYRQGPRLAIPQTGEPAGTDAATADAATAGIAQTSRASSDEPDGRPISERLGTAHRAWRSRGVSAVVSVGAVAGLIVLGALLGDSLGGGAGERSGQGQSSGPGPGALPGEPPPPLSGISDRPTGNPRIMVNQPQGDGDTIFVVHGTGWAPGQRVAIRLDGRRAAHNGPTIDRKGSFNYAINQERDFYPGQLPLGNHRVMVTAVGSPRAEVAFVVVP